MKAMPLCDAICRVEQAQGVLSVWMEMGIFNRTLSPSMVGALITLLEGVPEAMNAANSELVDYMKREGKA